jgi:hypothetical protein
MSIQRSRQTSRLEGEFVVFLIGMRVNAWWKPWKWLPVAAAMPRMLRELFANPDLGFLGGESWFGRTTVMVQYWRSREQLLAYASKRESEHLPAWRRFQRAVGTSGDVGIWHETYLVQAGSYENVYANMPPFGLGAVGERVEARGTLARAAGRLGREGESGAAGAPAEPAVRGSISSSPRSMPTGG